MHTEPNISELLSLAAKTGVQPDLLDRLASRSLKERPAVLAGLDRLLRLRSRFASAGQFSDWLITESPLLGDVSPLIAFLFRDSEDSDADRLDAFLLIAELTFPTRSTAKRELERA